MKGHTDDGPPKSDVPPKVNITSNSEMIELDDLRDLPEPLLKLGDLYSQSNIVNRRVNARYPTTPKMATAEGEHEETEGDQPS